MTEGTHRSQQPRAPEPALCHQHLRTVPTLLRGGRAPPRTQPSPSGAAATRLLTSLPVPESEFNAAGRCRIWAYERLDPNNTWRKVFRSGSTLLQG
ncbi:hypothetical protein IRJ41_013739 [Triplophysa rosa]|uniref:Uncharacterized protein n=1 Tax=Triplophysa rosa TaxID=992332 RepID=A0A9W7TXT6_TRIRA|nr:hypothetical protein IRJ41_013739 [Triplophysa rosa]